MTVKLNVGFFILLFIAPALATLFTYSDFTFIALAYIFWLLTAISLTTTAIYTRHVRRSKQYRFKIIQKEYEAKVMSIVVSYNEDPDMVRLCLAAVKRANLYGEVFLVDDSTKKEILDRNRATCQKIGINFVHRDNRRGFKAGALNDAVKEFGKDFDIIAVFDADQMPYPWFISSAIGYFQNPKIAFVQYPPSYTNLDTTVAMASMYQQEVFLRKIMRARNISSAFLLGSGFLIRKSALLEVGGFYENSITEDLATSILLHGNGWTSIYADFPGIWSGDAPRSLSAYTKQQFRWSFGGFESLGMLLRTKLHFSTFMDYLSGLLYWLYIGPVKLVMLASLLLFLIFRIHVIQLNPYLYALFYFPFLTYSILLYAFSADSKTMDYGVKGFFYHQAIENLVMFTVAISFLKFLAGTKQKFGVTFKGKDKMFTLRQLLPNSILHFLLIVAIILGLIWLRTATNGQLILSIWINIAFACLSLAFVITSDVMLISHTPPSVSQVKILETPSEEPT